MTRTALRGSALLAGFVLAAVAVHVAIVAAYANPIPFSDEWIAVVDDVMRRSAAGQLSILDLFQPHNEHTMVPTRLVALIALWLNHGQFDNVPVAMLNAVLYAGAMAFPLVLFWRHSTGAMRLFAAVLGLAALAPIEGEDLIFGFQNQYYFLLIGTIGALWLAATAVAGSTRALMVSAAAAVLATLSMGSGFFAALIAAFVCALRWRSEPPHRRGLRAHVAVGIAVTLLGVILVMHAFAVMKAAGILGDRHLDLDGIRRIFSCLSWPYGLAWPYAGTAWLGLLLSLPFAAFAVRLVLQRQAVVAPIDWFALGLGTWAAFQVCALAYSRHSEVTTLASRYLPVLLFWPAMNVYAVFRLAAAASESARTRTLRMALVLAPVLAAGALVSLVARIVPISLAAMAVASQQHQLQAEQLARYVRLGDRDALYKPPHMGLPYGNADKLSSLLDDPVVRSGLPANIRAPMRLAAAAEPATPFVPFGAFASVPRRDDLPGFGSFAAAGNPTVGTFVSEPLLTDFPYVRIDLAGYLPDPGLALKLDCPPPASCNAVEIRPPEYARETWRGIYAPVPQRRFRIVAEDHTSTLWLAFSAPVEVGRLSVLTDALANRLRADALTLVALLCGVLTVLLLLGLWPAVPARPGAEA